MELILPGHGKAEDFESGGRFERERVENGRRPATWAAEELERAGRLPELVVTSPGVRARYSAGGVPRVR